jgi:S1-C subfamily serine protease
LLQHLEFHIQCGYTSLGNVNPRFDCGSGNRGQNGNLRNLYREAFAMKKAVVLCALSATLGGLASLLMRDSPWTGTRSVAQEAMPQQGQPMPNVPAPVQPAGSSLLDSLTAEERVNVFVYQQGSRGVVNINTKGITGNLILAFESQGEGSGSVIDRDGHILTNFHVIEGANKIDVTLFDGNTYKAQLVGGDPYTDVAVLKIDAPPESLFPVAFGSSSNLLVGQRVFAIGNPFEFERTMSTGIISSLDRSLPSRRGPRPMKSIIQIDAAINPGNSGGPLLDSHARMIGMTMAIASKSGGSEGVGFAVPINTIARVVPQLIQNGRVQRPDTGIIKVLPTERGLFIALMTPKGPAQQAGLQGPRIEEKQQRQGPFVVKHQAPNWNFADMIVAVDGKPIKTPDDFNTIVDAKQPGQQVIITVIRGGQQVDVPLTLGLGG